MNLPLELRRISRRLDFTENDKAIVLLASRALRMDREPLAVLNLVELAKQSGDEQLIKAAQDVEGEWDG